MFSASSLALADTKKCSVADPGLYVCSLSGSGFIHVPYNYQEIISKKKILESYDLATNFNPIWLLNDFQNDGSNELVIFLQNKKSKKVVAGIVDAKNKSTAIPALPQGIDLIRYHHWEIRNGAFMVNADGRGSLKLSYKKGKYFWKIEGRSD